MTENSKRVKLKEQLAARITGGKFKFGDRFPGLHQLCNEYKVSYVTMNKAMKLLVKEGYLLAKNGIGYFVCYVPSDIVPPRKVVNFITGLTKLSSDWDIVLKGKELFERAGWNVKLRTVPDGDISSCVPEINSPDAYSVLFFTKVNWENFTATFRHVTQRVIVLGHLSGNADITSIISDEYETVRRCIEYFRERNHTKTALVSTSPTKELDMLRIAAWRTLMLSNGCTPENLNKNCFVLENFLKISNEEIKAAYSKWIRNNKDNIDSVIDPLAPGLLADACRENGLRVPEDVAILAIARSKPSFTEHQIPTLHNNLYKHFEFAFSIIEERFKTRRNAPGTWIFCPPGDFVI